MWNNEWKKGASYGYFDSNKPMDIKFGFYLTEIIEKANNIEKKENNVE